jgi:hypothetical protein
MFELYVVHCKCDVHGTWGQRPKSIWVSEWTYIVRQHVSVKYCYIVTCLVTFYIIMWSFHFDRYFIKGIHVLSSQVLLGRSDVSGWGAFLKVKQFIWSFPFLLPSSYLIWLFLNLQNSVSKHEYLGEYTGELISHKEADKRGKIYDRENSSFLFNLNNEVGLQNYPLQAFSY